MVVWKKSMEPGHSMDVAKERDEIQRLGKIVPS